MQGESVYRVGIGSAIGGGVAVIIGVCLGIGEIVVWTRTGHLELFDNHAVPHPATLVEVLLLVVLPFVAVLAGSFVLTVYRNWQFRIDDEGVSSTDWRGREDFRAKWSEITALKTRSAKGTRTTVYAGAQSTDIIDGTKNWQELVAEIKRRAPHIEVR